MRLLILADDLTGALDTAVQFARQGVHTVVSTALTAKADVVAMDTQSRHLPPEQAYQRVYELTAQARRLGFSHYYKKTDSVLRGNIGSEIDAVMSALAMDQMPFVPAYPQTGRTTRDGIQYVQDVPLAQSPFGSDPFHPIRTSRVTEILAQQTARTGITVHDAQSEEDLLRLSKTLPLTLSAGCAGFARYLPDALGLPRNKLMPQRGSGRIGIICASLHPVSLAQVEYAAAHGFGLYALTEPQRLGRTELALPATDEPLMVVATQSAALTDVQPSQAGQVASVMGEAARLMAQRCDTLIVIGGDTLHSVLASLHCTELTPVKELMPGVALSQMGDGRSIVSKSGGFGKPDTLVRIVEELKNWGTQP